jgi:hypothetical protein
MRLAAQGHGTAAVYLWGYVAEMTLKAAWFTLLGFPETRTITFQDLHSAVQLARNYGIAWPGRNFHALSHWAQLLVQHRIVVKGGYPDPQFGASVQEHCDRIYDRWQETLRYKRNRAYVFEVQAVADSTEWLLSNRLD